MATVTGLTAARMLQIEGQSVVSGQVDSNGDLILTTHGGSNINAGQVKGADGDPGTDGPSTVVPEDATAAEVNLIISSADPGTTIDFGPFTRTFDAPIIVNNLVNLKGSGTGVIGTSPSGTRFIFPDAVDTTGGAVRIEHDYVSVSDIFITGVSKPVGSIGWHVVGTSVNYTHGVRLTKCGAAGFDYGSMNGSWSDHTSYLGCKFSGNNHGTGFDFDTHHDFDYISCFLEGNTHCSAHLVEDTSVVNVSMIRSHLGFSQYGIWQDPTTLGRGYAGLTLIDSPIEAVSNGHINIQYGGPIRVQGGYWLWNGTPSTRACYIKELNTGGLWLSTRLEPNTPNPNSPALVEVAGYAPGLEVEIETKLSGFAQTEYIGSAPAVINKRPTNRIYQHGANRGMAWDSVGLYIDAPGDIRFRNASYATIGRWWDVGQRFIMPAFAIGPAGSATAPTITSGEGAPSAAMPDGSIYLRQDHGGVIYRRVSGQWLSPLDISHLPVEIRRGTWSVPAVSANSGGGGGYVSFGTPFASASNIFISVMLPSGRLSWAQNGITASGFTLSIDNHSNGTSSAGTAYWKAERFA